MFNYKYKMSVVIPVYNCELHLESCLESLNRQTMKRSDFQIVFVNDGSKDNSGMICKTFAATDENIVYSDSFFKNTNEKTNASFDEIKSYIENYNSKQNNNTTIVQNIKSPIEQIKELKELLDIGAITQEEFDKKKNQLLNI